jgi:lysophospholipase L1-like esterase
MPTLLKMLLVGLAALAALAVTVFWVRHSYIQAKIAAVERPVNAPIRQWPQEGPPDIILFGDSRIARWQPPLAVQGARILNRGIGGETTVQMLDRFETDVILARPKIVVIQAGINDLVAAGLSENRHNDIQEAAVQNLTEICTRAIANGIECVLLKVIPTSDVSWLRRLVWSAQIPVLVEKSNLQLDGVNHSGVTLFDPGRVLMPNGNWHSEYVSDELHITPEAYRELNSALEPILAELLRR